MAQYTGKKLDIATDYITHYILANHMATGDRLPTEKQLMEETGVSRVTLRRALANLQQKGALYAVQGSGYFVGKSSELTKAQAIPIVVSYDSSTSRIMEVIQGAQRYLDSVNCSLTLTVTGRDAKKERDKIEQLYRSGVRQVMILPVSSEDNRDFYFQMAQAGMSLVFIDRAPNSISCYSLVQSDNMTGGYLAARHMIEQGHRRIAVFGLEPLQRTSTIAERYAGYCYAMRESGLPLPEKNYFYSPYQRSSSDVDELLDPANGITAVCAINDHAAIDIIHHAQQRGLRVPQDLAVSGFDNLDITSQIVPTVTTVNQNFKQIGKAAAQIAYELMTETSIGNITRHLPVDLVIRDSTK